MKVNFFAFAIVSLILGSCSKPPPMDDGTVSCEVQRRIGSYTAWRPCANAPEEDIDLLNYLLSNELTPNTAIQIALINNPKIQSFFEEIGIAHADLVAAGLLSNPVLDLDLRYPSNQHLHVNIEYLITTSMLDFLLIPLKTRMATTAFNQAKLAVSDQILSLAFDVRRAYTELIIEKTKYLLAREIAELANIEFEIASRQYAVGNINILRLQDVQAQNIEAELSLADYQQNITRLTQNLMLLLGLPDSCAVLLPDTLSETLPEETFDLCSLETTALNERLEIQIGMLEINKICQMLGIEQWWRYTNLYAGVAGEREPEGENVIGPGFQAELPIFNYGQANRARLHAQLRQATQKLNELHIKVLNEVIESFRILEITHSRAKNFKEELLALLNNKTANSVDYYNIMGLGIDSLIHIKSQQLEVELKYHEALKEFLLAQINLDKALGGNLQRYQP